MFHASCSMEGHNNGQVCICHVAILVRSLMCFSVGQFYVLLVGVQDIGIWLRHSWSGV